MQKAPYWFPAKRYGWGWGLPSSWQGWVVMGSFLALLLLVAYGFPPSQEPKAFAFCVALLCAALFAICFLKGEPPRWRWGK